MLFHTTVNIVLFSSSANVLVFGDFRVHFKGWINYSGGTDRPVVFFLSQMIFLKLLTSQHGFLALVLTTLLF